MPRPHARSLLVLLVSGLVLLAGCLGGDAAPDPAKDPVGSDGPSLTPNGTTTGPTPSGGSPGPSGSPSPTPTNGTNGNNSGGNNTGNGTPDPPNWPDIGSAVIRPGIKLLIENGYCTANFVFRSPENGTLYLGTAAHCMYQNVGARVSMPPDLTYVNGADGEEFGTVVYSSYATLGIEDPGDGTHQDMNDFALIQIDDDWVSKTHPAMLNYGGPTAVAPVSDVSTLDRVLSFGNSPLRPGPEQLDWHEGYVTGVEDWTVYAYTVGPGIPGDSGSGVLLDDGRALGILVAMGRVPPAENFITPLEDAMAFAAENGWPVELQTWELLDGGLLPI